MTLDIGRNLLCEQLTRDSGTKGRWLNLFLLKAHENHERARSHARALENVKFRYFGITVIGEALMADIDAVLEQSSRFQVFRNDLIQNIPRIPNNKESFDALKSEKPTDLLIIYMCWRLRHIGIRPRMVIGASSLDSHPCTAALRPNISAFIRAVETGADLSPYLSRRAHRRGYVFEDNPEMESDANRVDRDLLLNVMGFHHVHLGLYRQPNGLMKRTKIVMFASVTRNTFEILGLFNHEVFKWETDDKMSSERERLWSIFNEYQVKNTLPGQLPIGSYGPLGNTLAGTPLIVTLKAIRQIEIVREIESNIDDLAFLRDRFGEHLISRNLKWHYKHLDFGLLDEPSSRFFVLMAGPN